MVILFVMVLLAGVSPLIFLPVSLLYNSDHDRVIAFKMAHGYCTTPGCWRGGKYDHEVTQCFYPDNYNWDEPDEILCYDHIAHSGFCMGCGQFWGGIESFDIWHPGWCDNCWDEIRSNDDDYYDDNDYAEFGYGDFDPYYDHSDWWDEPINDR